MQKYRSAITQLEKFNARLESEIEQIVEKKLQKKILKNLTN